MSGNVETRVFETVDIDGESLRVSVSPGPGTPLVICNDFAANLDVLDDFVVALARPTLCFDLPGIGGSADAAAMRRMPALSRLLASLLEALSMPRRVDVMGIGWGGLLAQQFARDHRDRVRRLVLTATSSGQLMFPGRLASLWRLARSGGLVRAAPSAQDARILFGGRRNDECNAIANGLSRAIRPTRRGHAGQLYALTGYSSLPWLHRLNVPTLVMAGDDDNIVPMVNARVLALLLPLARLAIIRGGGHWFVLERTDEVVRVLESFLDARVAITDADQDNTL
ncbi:alpha/beta fold hydrolase [Salinisphaera aquimarina]|uniref:Alpha/beta fold hydrolase n=1 Tax=Salinisphaera aquimarina TaxID=2094031 RepID=A0ABV7EJ70_9GAMM